MAGTEAFHLPSPEAENLDAAAHAWTQSRSQLLLSAGTTWWRALKAGSESLACDYAETCFPSPNLARFTPIKALGNDVPAAYAGSRPEVALWELVLRRVRHEGIRRVPRHETLNRWLVEVKLDRDLVLLDMHRPKDLLLVAHGKRAPELSRAWPQAYAVTREWAQKLYDRIPQIDGLHYESHQVSGQCVILYQPDNAKVFTVAGRPVRVEDSPVREILIREAGAAGAVVDFGDPDP